MRDILESAGLRVRAGCRGNGACGLCLVRVEAGERGDLTSAEHLMVSPELLAQNLRLACQFLPKSDLGIRIIETLANTTWRDLSPDYLPCAPASHHRDEARPSAGDEYGLAIDVGTTQISLSLWDLQHGYRLTGRIGLNPQFQYGSDVVTRLVAARDSIDQAQHIARLPLEAVCEALLDMSLREGIRLQQVTHVTVVGNTAMLALLTETDPRQLLHPQAWTRPLDCTAMQPWNWGHTLGIHPQASVDVIAPLAGFVGSDLLAGVVATRLTEQPGGLLIDFGTNTELALWDGHTLWVTSAAGGPAFESSGISCGMPAEPGAIFRVDRQQATDALQYQVLGGRSRQRVLWIRYRQYDCLPV